LSDVILELELELLSGPESALIELAAALRQAPHHVIQLTASDVSKAQRGLALFAQSTRS
jgi:triphosphatase